MTHFCSPLNVCIVIQWMLPFISAGTLPPNWKDFIDPDILAKSKDDQSRYDVDKLEGDINNLDPSEMPTNAGANAVDDKNALWPNSTIPYEFTKQSSTRFRPAERTMIMEAMNIIMHLTGQCVKFVQRTTEQDYVKFQKGPLCFSDIGRIGGRQTISLSPACVERYGCIQHEVMHVLGFYHEQSRLDRDEHMFINWDNIAAENKDQFTKRSGITYGLPYDYESIMHYAFNAFATDDQLPTIVPKVARAKIGQNENLSPLDVVRIHRRFKCNIPAGKAFASPQAGSQSKGEQSRTGQRDSDGNKACEKNFFPPICNETGNGIHKGDKDNIVNMESDVTFSDEPMTKEQCAPQFTAHCRNAIRTIDNCMGFKGLEIYCTGPIILSEITTIVTALSKPPVRAVYLGIADGPLVTYQTFAPVRTQIVRFILNDCLTHRPTAKLAELRLTNLWHFELNNCYDLDMRKDDYQYSRKIRVLIFYASTIRTLERGIFSDLPDLQLVAMEWWMNKHEVFPLKLRESSYELHCGSELAWFRRWLKNNTKLLQSGQYRKLYSIPDSWFNYDYSREEMYLPIDCAKPFPSVKAAVNFSQMEFSINDKEDQCR